MVRFFGSAPFFLSLWLLAAPATAQEQHLRITSLTFPDTPWHTLWLDFMEALEKQPGNELQTIPYILGQLGSEESALSQLRRGRLQMGGFSLQGSSAVVPELGILTVPYLFDSFAEIDYVMDHHLFGVFSRLLAEKNMHLLRWGEVGWTYFYGTRRLQSPAEARGRRLRSSNALASQYVIRSVGANMVPMTFSDLIPSLQTGLVEGGTSGLVIFVLSGAARYAPEISLTRHAFDAGIIVANRSWWQQLPAQARTAIHASLASSQRLRQSVRERELQILADPEAYGVRLYQPNAAELAAWRASTRGARQRLVQAIGGRAQEVYDIVQRAKAEFAARQH